MDGHTGTRLPGPLLAGSAVLLLTLTLRAPTTAVAPVVPAIGADLHLGSTTLALLTSLPLACFIVVAPLVPAMLRRLGLRVLITMALLLAAAGTITRSLPGLIWLMTGTVALGAAVAVASVLTPTVVRTLRPDAPRPLTAIYTTGLSLGPAAAAGLTIPAGELLGEGWRTALTWWAVLPMAALGLWLSVCRVKPRVSASEPPVDPRPGVLREPIAWALTGYLASSSLLFYTVAAWLPTILQDTGMTGATAGSTAAITGVMAVPAALAAPLFARTRQGTRTIAAVAPIPFLAGLVLLSSTSEFWVIVIAVVLLGIGQGASTAMAYTLVIGRARSSTHATTLSAMSQTIGVTMAALGPLALGASHDLLGAWGPGLLGAAIIALLQAVLGYGIGRSSPER